MQLPPIEVEVVFALSNEQRLRRVSVPAGCSAMEAIVAAGLDSEWLAGDQPLQLARFGRLITPATLLEAGDRVEILRPLVTDPKEQRRQKVKAAARARRRSA